MLGISDTESDLILDSGIVLPYGYEDNSEKVKGGNLRIDFPVDDFDSSLISDVIDQALLQSSVRRTQFWLPKMQRKQDKFADARRRGYYK